MKNDTEEKRRPYYLFSPFLRFFHWTMVLSMAVLCVTGFFITKPIAILGIDPTHSYHLMNLNRNVHFLAAFLFCTAFILRIYGFVINRGDRLFPHFWKREFYQDAVEVTLHYIFLKKEHAPFLRNPLARVAYFTLYAMVGIEILTGFAMYNMTEANSIGGMLFGWVNTILGGEFRTHIVHHYMAWACVLFFLGHLYLVVRAEFMEKSGEVSSMFAGYKFLPHQPKDMQDIGIKDGK